MNGLLQHLATIGLVVMLALPGTAQRRSASPDRDADPPAGDVGAASASHRELKPLDIPFGAITALHLHPDGDLLATDGQARQIKIISPAGKQVGSIELDFAPEALDVSADGTLFCGGQGRLAKLTKNGRVLKIVDVPGATDSQVDETTRRRARDRPTRISGIAATDRHVFVAFGSGWSLGSKSRLFRFDLDWENAKLLAEGLRGCCQRCDLAAHNGVLYLAENAAHRVVAYDRDGTILNKWGTQSRLALEGFGSCCNPMNLCFDGEGVLYTAESGLGRVKRYTSDGRFLGLVGYIGVERFSLAGDLAASCSNIAIAVTPDGGRVYVMDFKNNQVRILEKN